MLDGFCYDESQDVRMDAHEIFKKQCTFNLAF